MDFAPLADAIIGVCPGTGGYEGLTYLFQHTSAEFVDGTNLRGVIYEGAPPAWDWAASEPAASPSPAASLATIGLPADDGARIVAVEELDASTRDLVPFRSCRWLATLARRGRDVRTRR